LFLDYEPSQNNLADRLNFNDFNKLKVEEAVEKPGHLNSQSTGISQSLFG